MKNKYITIAVLATTVVMVVAAVILAVKLKNLGTQPIAPSAPQSKPKANVDPLANVTPAAGCQLTMSVSTLTSTPTPPISVTPTPTVKFTPTPTKTPTKTPSPTPTPTETPLPTQTPTATPTNTPKPTGTVIPGESYCEYMTASPGEGATPLTVRFTGKGFDTEKIKGYRFFFGDGERMEYLGEFSPGYVQEAEYIYSRAGKYTTYLEILDAGDHWKTREECRVTITVTGTTPTPTPVTPTSTVQPTGTPNPTGVPPTPTEVLLPEAGLKIPTLGGILIGIFLVAVGAALVF